VTDPSAYEHHRRSDEIESKQVTFSLLSRVTDRIVSAQEGQANDSENEEDRRNPEVSVLVPGWHRKWLFVLLSHKATILPRRRIPETV